MAVRSTFSTWKYDSRTNATTTTAVMAAIVLTNMRKTMPTIIPARKLVPTFVAIGATRSNRLGSRCGAAVAGISVSLVRGDDDDVRRGSTKPDGGGVVVRAELPSPGNDTGGGAS